MNTETRTKTVHYKRVVLTNCKNNLQELLLDVFRDGGGAKKAQARLESISQDGEIFRLVNHFQSKNNMFFGQLVVFENGRGQALLTIDDDAEFFSIAALEASKIAEQSTDSATVEYEHKSESNSAGDTPNGEKASNVGEDEDKKVKRRREFVDSMLYFGVKGNDLVIVQSLALKARDLEAHLKWLLEYHTDKFGSKSAIILQDKPTPEIIKRVESNPAKSICIGAPIETGDGVLVDSPEHAQPDENPITTESANKLRFVPKGMGAELIKSMLSQDWFNKQDLSEALDEANLKVSVEITYMRKTTKNGHRLLDNMATALRHQHEDDVKVVLDGGGILTGKDFKLSGKISVKMFNGIVDENSLYDKLTEWLRQKVQDKEVDAAASNSHKKATESET